MTSVRLRGVSRPLGLNPRRRAARGAAPPSIVQDGLVAEWRFDNGAGQVLTDYADGHHGQLGVDAGAANDPAWVTGGLSFTGLHASEFDCVVTEAFSFPSPASMWTSWAGLPAARPRASILLSRLAEKQVLRQMMTIRR